MNVENRLRRWGFDTEGLGHKLFVYRDGKCIGLYEKDSEVMHVYIHRMDEAMMSEILKDVIVSAMEKAK